MRSGLFKTAIKLAGDFDIDHFTTTHIGVGGLDGAEHASKFTCFRIDLGDGEAHCSNAIDITLVVVLLEFLVIATKGNKSLGVLNTGGESTTLGIDEVARARPASLNCVEDGNG